MCRCKACDKIMSDSEMSNKDKSGKYEELCFRCLREAGIAVNYDYVETAEIEEDAHQE